MSAPEPTGLLDPRPDVIAQAVRALRQGQLVVMPTETVYGLAADARNPVAVARIFAAKGRPADNPLIVHVPTLEAVHDVVANWPTRAARLAEAFWPGPLTLVLPKRASVPSAVTAGRGTVAVRVPAHPVAQALLRAVRLPLAAPSANVFTRLSPTQEAHVDPTLLAHAALGLAGGPAKVGLESTIVDLSGPLPVLLRPGGLSRDALEAVLGEALRNRVDETHGPRTAPGRYPRHYAPRTRVVLVDEADSDAVAITLGQPRGPRHHALPEEPGGYGAGLYAALHELDALCADEIQVERPPTGPGWEAVHDRLRRATHP